MDDHFWPSMYPGIIVGLLIGLSGRSFASTLLGAFSGLMGAYFGFFAASYFEIDQGFFAVVAVVVGAVFVSKVFLMASSKIMN